MFYNKYIYVKQNPQEKIIKFDDSKNCLTHVLGQSEKFSLCMVKKNILNYTNIKLTISHFIIYYT